MPLLDTLPRFQLALRLASFGVQFGFTFSLALVAADIAGQLAPPHQRALWFGLASGTAALGFWWTFGWIWFMKRVGINSRHGAAALS